MPHRTYNAPLFERLVLPPQSCHVLLMHLQQQRWMAPLASLLRDAGIRVMHTTSCAHVHTLVRTLAPLVLVSPPGALDLPGDPPARLILTEGMGWSMLLDQMWLHLSRWHRAPPPQPATPASLMPPCTDVSRLVLEALQYIEWHLERPLTNASVAQALQVSEDELVRCLLTSGLRTVPLIQHQLRMQRAKRMIQHSHLDIAGIAMSLGFNNLRSFVRSVRHFTGLTPKQLRCQPASGF